VTAALWACLLLAQGAALFELEGQIEPADRASVAVHGAITPFATSTMSDSRGRFRVKGLAAGDYTVAVFLPGRGEVRETVAVGPGTADDKRRVRATFRVEEHRIARDPRDGTVSSRQLSIPVAAWREFAQAQKALEKRDVPAAVKRLERAVEIAPRFSEAWNTLGTIAYQSRDLRRAEECFRTALEADPKAWEPLVNLGGALLSALKLDEALTCNIHAVLARPNDALANSQLGMTYFELGRPDLAEKYLTTAVRLDPAHFSHPQLVLAEIHLRRGERERAAEVLEDFLRRHPDWHAAEKMREAIRKLYSSPR
jgi:Tfp pilus assembly protein PilF